MSTVEATRQQLDPAATFGAYRSTVIFGFVVVIGAVVLAMIGGDPADRAPILIASLVVVIAAALWLLRAADPLRAPFRRRSMVVVFSLALIAGVLSVYATLGYDALLIDDWAVGAVGVLTVAMTPYRPARELFIGFGVVIVALGLVSLMKVPYLAGDGPGLAFVVVGLAPTIAVSIASIQYSRLLVAGLWSWQRRADVGAAALATDMVGGVATSVERERVAILARDVSPFFTELLERGSVTESDRVRARSIAEEMRSAMVASANQTWLTAATQAEAARRGAGFLTVDDPSYLAVRMASRQRTALRAILMAIVEDERLTSARVGIRDDEVVYSVTISIGLGDHAPARVAADYDTYFSVLRVVFAHFRVDVDVEGQTVKARFDYDRS